MKHATSLVCYLWKGCCIWSCWNANSCPHMIHIQTFWWIDFMPNLCRHDNKSTYVLLSTLEFQGIGYLHQSDMHFTEQSKNPKKTWSITSGMSLLHKQSNVCAGSQNSKAWWESLSCPHSSYHMACFSMRKERQHEIIVPRTAFFLLQIRLSNNENIFGTFLSTDLLKDVKRFVDANRTDGKQTYSLAIPFPRKTFCKSGLWIL